MSPLTNISSLPPSALIRLPTVQSLTGLCKSDIYAKGQAGQFPRPYKLGAGARAAAWRLGEVMAWLEQPLEWCTQAAPSTTVVSATQAR